MLADLILTDLPLEALVALKHAINDEILRRKKQSRVERTRTFLDTWSFKDLPSTTTYEEAVQAWLTHHASELFSIPGHTHRSHFNDRLKYLPCLLAQDWTVLFPTASTTEPIYYVYAHLDPGEQPASLPELHVFLKGTPFYIGKGSGNRAWDLKRNQGHAKAIKRLREAGFPDDAIVQVIASNLSEQVALCLEAKLIYLFGSIYDKTVLGCLLNLADHMKPNFVGPMTRLPPRKSWHERQAKRAQLLTEEIAALSQ